MTRRIRVASISKPRSGDPDWRARCLLGNAVSCRSPPLVGVGWAAGYAQTHAQAGAALGKPTPPELSANSDFELQVFSENGEVEVRCVRGCKLTWAPTVARPDGQVDILVPGDKVRGIVTDQRCVANGWNGSSNCHILGWKK